MLQRQHGDCVAAAVRDVRHSRFNLCTEVGADEVLLTNLLSRTVLRTTRAQKELLDSLSGGVALKELDRDERSLVAQFVSGLFILPDEFDEEAFIADSHAQARASRRLKTIVIAPTMRCNMSCHYCFENKTEQCLSASLQNSLVERVSADLHGFDGLHVQWFGGEPLLEMEAIRRLTAKLRSTCDTAGKTYSAEVVTNGVLLDAKVASDLAALGVGEAQVTLEGARRLHDKVRFTSGHEGTFEQVLQGISSASPFIKINVRVHVAPYNVDSVLELLDVLSERKLQRCIGRVYFSPLFNYRTQDSKIQFRVEPRKFYGSEEFAASQIRLLEVAAARGFNTGDPLNASYALCVAMLDGTEVFGPSGAIAKCYLDTNEQDKAFDSLQGSGRSEAVLQQWTGYDYRADAECVACQFSPVCLGGCPTQRMHRADKDLVCTPLKFNFHERMRLAYPSAVNGPASPP